MAAASQPLRRIVIVGGGFGGVVAAAQLAGTRGLDVTLISNHHTFAYYPQMYHSATGGSRAEVALMLTDLLGGKAVNLVTDTITDLDPNQQTLTGASGQTYHYDRLVLALGNVTNYFGIKGLQEFAFDIKTIDGAEKFKRHIHSQILDTHVGERNFVVVGGGPTGIEVAGSLGEYIERIAKLHKLATPKITIDLVEAAPRLLPRSPGAYAGKVLHRLEKLGVTVMTGVTVEAETADTLTVAGKPIHTSTVVWTAGTANNPFYKAHEDLFTLVKPGRVQVDEHLQGRGNVYVIGDNAATPFSGLAETAVGDAHFVAGDIKRELRGSARPAYKPKPPISVIPVGPGWAAAQWGKLFIYGWPGWVLRRLGDLVGYADIESWPAALQVWLLDHLHDTGCPICDTGQKSAEKPSKAASADQKTTSNSTK